MPPQVKGIRDTLNVQQAKMKIDMSEKIALLQPEATPFITFMKRAKNKTEAANNPKFSWLEDDLGARWDAINNAAGYAAGVTDIIVDNGDYFSVGDLVKVPRTGEVLAVTAVNVNTLTVVRGYGVTAAAAIVDNDPIVIIGNANQEGSGTREIKTTNEIEVFNYTQIFKTPFGVTNTQNASANYGMKDLAYQQKKKGTEHMMDMSRSFLFGEKKLDTSGNKPKRTTGGLLSFLTANRYDAGGALTQSEFDQNIAEVVFKYGSSEKLMLASARLLSVINGWAMGKLQIEQGEKTFGLSVVKYVTPFGTLNLVHEPLFEGAVYGSYGMVLDPENFKYRPLKGRDTKLETNIQANDEDLREDQYITEAGLEVRLPKTHAVITGVTS
ncbi:hypothetical protein CVD25_01075 [Bacillus canaveralius]|uniref:Phage major capsid protein n=1 Tax=Bacillus canaveralius TaxID=1403243 RepID=A0A2N5GPM0_9BACI|nr:DUF5309 family protein [Bacillus canaveralius]PLR84656.1 hypothetical protein CU635_06185 [Bacillus canaveralius]PLS00808.1 hypothetical protein CVD25_01075 [Bacillus canaveralius]